MFLKKAVIMGTFFLAAIDSISMVLWFLLPCCQLVACIFLYIFLLFLRSLRQLKSHAWGPTNICQAVPACVDIGR